MISGNTIATGLGALVLSATFLVGERVRFLRRVIRDEGRVLSLGAGVSIAYVFVHMMPEMADAREAYATSAKTPVIFEGIVVYYIAMIGFMVYYGLDRLRQRIRSAAKGRESLADYRIHLAGFAIYVWLIAYLLVNRLQHTSMAIGLYTFAMVAHFMTIDHALQEQHHHLFEHTGRPILAAMCALGWVMGFFLPLPTYVLAPMVAFVSGAIIMNSAIMELGQRQVERFVAFIVGGLIYGLLLIPLG